MKSLIALTLLISTSIMAETATTELPVVDPVSTGYLMKLTGGLLVIIVLIFALAWLMKKLQLTQNSQNGLIKIVSAISVGHRDRIALIQVGDEQILVGLTPGNMHKLHTLKKPVSLTAADQPEAQSFSKKFNQLLNKEPQRGR